ncbi:MAG TPA: hypothetical protein PKV98_04030 [Burkholderiaceae bacterium]|nr:hypothetical protein [Burkholderiaceae bacterium]
MEAGLGSDARFRRLRYALISRLYHQPELLRRVARFLRRKPSFARIARVVAGRDTVKAVFHRQWSFSTTQAPNMLAGDFVIGMEAGTRQKADRAFLRRVIGSPDAFGAASARVSAELIGRRREAQAGSFDLIDDYMAHVVWAPLAEALGASAAKEIKPPAEADKSPNALFHELRSLGAQLIIGSVASDKDRKAAAQAGASVNQRVTAAHAALRHEWAQHCPSCPEATHRNAVGLMWVAHPATVQAGALCMQELLTSQRKRCADLAAQAKQLDGQAWTDSDFRASLRGAVLELLSRRPPFPILARFVPRNASFSVGEGFPPGQAAAGSELILLVIGALDDPAASAPAQDDRFLMFGSGERACIAKEHVVEILVSALAGLLLLPNLRWAHRWGRRMEYDGPVISRMYLKFG